MFALAKIVQPVRRPLPFLRSPVNLPAQRSPRGIDAESSGRVLENNSYGHPRHRPRSASLSQAMHTAFRLNALRRASFIRLLVVTAMLLSWLVITNHCSLVRMQREWQPIRHACCHRDSSQPGKHPPMEMRQCCRAIKASLAGNVEMNFDESNFEMQTWVVSRFLAAQVDSRLTTCIFDHRPHRRCLSRN